jgi:hypothetical protein
MAEDVEEGDIGLMGTDSEECDMARGMGDDNDDV